MTNRPASIVLTLKVTLHPQDVSPPIWRRLWVDGSVTLAKLHHFLQAAFGWHDAHLHEFKIDKVLYREPDAEVDSPDYPSKDEKKAVLGKLVRSGDRFTYIYDFGDHWEHEIEVESVEKIDGIAPGDYSIEGGARSAPPEDVGGIGGYIDFLEEILSKPLSAEGKRLQGWAGGHFDPELFDQSAANAAIKRILWNHWGGR